MNGARVLVYDYDSISIIGSHDGDNIHIPIVANDIVATLERYAETNKARPFGPVVLLLNMQHVLIQSIESGGVLGLPASLTKQEAQLAARNQTLPMVQRFPFDTDDCLIVYRKQRADRWEATIGRYAVQFAERVKMAIEKNKGKVIQVYALAEAIANSAPENIPVVIPSGNIDTVVYITKNIVAVTEHQLPPVGSHQDVIAKIISSIRRSYGAVAANKIVIPLEMSPEDVNIFADNYGVDVLRITDDQDRVMSWRQMAYHGAIKMLAGDAVRPPLSIMPLDDILNAQKQSAIITGLISGLAAGFAILGFVFLQFNNSVQMTNHVKYVQTQTAQTLAKEEAGLPTYSDQEITQAVMEKRSIIRAMNRLINLGNFSAAHHFYWTQYQAQGDGITINATNIRLYNAIVFIHKNPTFGIDHWSPLLGTNTLKVSVATPGGPGTAGDGGPPTSAAPPTAPPAGTTTNVPPPAPAQ